MDLRVALENDEFFLAYQPTFDLSDMSPTGTRGADPLEQPHARDRPARRLHPAAGGDRADHGDRQMGARARLRSGRRVARGRVSDRHGRQRLGTPARLRSRSSPTCKHALSESGLDPGALTLEITETTLMRDAEETVRRLTAIKALGVRVAIDDFGTGYSSLAHLRQFPVDALKIDRSFITGLAHNLEGETLIHTLVQLGKALSIETLAEGIEQPNELSLLREEQLRRRTGLPVRAPAGCVAFDSSASVHGHRRDRTTEGTRKRRRHGERKSGAPVVATVVETTTQDRCRGPLMSQGTADRDDVAMTRLVSRAVKRAQEGDREALGFLYARYADDVLGYVRSIVRDQHEAEDITQQVFAKLIHVICKYQEREVPFFAWILRVARNAAVDHLRRRRTIPVAEIRGADDADEPGAAERISDLREALATLPADQREVLVLRHFAGLSPTEIAERTGRTEGSVHGLHHRGRRALKAELTSRGAAPATGRSRHRSPEIDD